MGRVLQLHNRLRRLEVKRKFRENPPLLIIDNSRGELDPAEKERLIAEAHAEGRLVVTLRDPTRDAKKPTTG